MTKKYKPEAPPKAKHPGASGHLDARGLRFGVVVARFNEFITERLLTSALDALRRAGADDHHIELVRVPGSFEIPIAARQLAETHRFDAILCLGCILRGDTTHYEHISTEVTRGIGQSAQETGIPHAYGVLTCDTLEQAIDRAGLKSGNKGAEAALTAIEMASLRKAIRKSGAGHDKRHDFDPATQRERRARPRLNDLHRTVERVLDQHGHPRKRG
ncbi:MAG TPA: 6,7-dimethyl-8-ribityllumazine synthase [Terriglobales bacterium]|jgi:6,7-dimethyl-8-ribityllumazine synthase|nr:6,7-dimethyl-8-ribityllumazine synthase [Terriglobales bacterium]